MLAITAFALLQAPENLYCSSDYADDLGALSTSARAVDRASDAQFSYCVRNVAVYECLSYGPDGNVRKLRRRAVLHGTAFAYQQQGADTLLLTNDHVAAWPAVTDDDHSVDGVPAGCKKVSENLRIVDNDEDAYDLDDIPLTRLVTDPQRDVAILRAHSKLQVLPWKIGRSAALRDRNVVEVRGFPLGAFRATNVGKVVSAFDHDSYKDWDHDDFVIDALLSSGNSGSPVLAVSCKTGEFELVGIFHAAYSRGSALNVVVGIDQVLDLMRTQKRTPHTPAEVALGPAQRTALATGLGQLGELYFPFGALTALVRPRSDGALVFELFPREFPLRSRPLAVLEDAGSPSAFGQGGAVWFGGERGFKAYARSDLDADTQAMVARLLDALRRDALGGLALTQAARDAEKSRGEFERTSKLRAEVNRTAQSRRDLAQAAADVADRLAPQAGDPTHGLAELLAPPTPPTPVVP